MRRLLALAVDVALSLLMIALLVIPGCMLIFWIQDITIYAP